MRPPPAAVLPPGCVLAAYVATTTQLAQTVETLRAHAGFTEPTATETLVRLACRGPLGPAGTSDGRPHRISCHTRRLAPGSGGPSRSADRRPAPMARITPVQDQRPGRVSLLRRCVMVGAIHYRTRSATPCWRSSGRSRDEVDRLRERVASYPHDIAMRNAGWPTPARMPGPPPPTTSGSRQPCARRGTRSSR